MGLLAALSLILALGGAWTGSAHAQVGKLSLIRDAETEDTIRLIATPLFRAAHLDPASIKIHIVADRQINSFVAEGRHMFLFTGMIMACDGPDMLAGVIAHETGHIADGHLVRWRTAYERASAIQILAAVLGLAVGLLGGGGAGAAIMASGGGIAQRDFFAYDRVKEASADQAALKYLNDTHQSAEGLLKLFQKLEDEELLVSSRQDPYLQTHPLTQDRIQVVEQDIKTSRWSNAKEPAWLVDRVKLMVAKLYGFLRAPRLVYLHYPESDKSIYARYAWAIAKHRETKNDEALALTDTLIADRPDYGYFWELKGQIQFEDGDYKDAVPSLEKAVSLVPKQPLVRQLLGRVLVEVGTPDALKQAVDELELAVRQDDEDPDSWQLLANAYGKQGKLPLADVSSAESAYLLGDMKRANDLASRAMKGLDRGSPEWLHASDIVAATDNAKDNGGDSGQ